MCVCEGYSVCRPCGCGVCVGGDEMGPSLIGG